MKDEHGAERRKDGSNLELPHLGESRIGIKENTAPSNGGTDLACDVRQSPGYFAPEFRVDSAMVRTIWLADDLPLDPCQACEEMKSEC